MRIPFFAGALTLAAGLIVTAFAGHIVRIFNDDPAVTAMAVRYVQVVLPFCWAFSVFSSIIAYCNGMGLLKYSTTVNLVVLWVVRIPVAILMRRVLGTLFGIGLGDLETIEILLLALKMIGVIIFAFIDN
jgi:Na+-driven multidrug efflux pump